MVPIIHSIVVLAAVQPAYSWTTLPIRTIAPPASSARISSTFQLISPLHSSKESEDLALQLPSMGLNELQTQFRLAIAREDYDAATLYRDELADRVSSGAYRPSDDNEEESVDAKRARLSWEGLGTAAWLKERLDALEYPLPTTIQINAFEAVNSILTSHETMIRRDDDTLEERMQKQAPQNMGVVISGSTGSGKTLAFLVPTLSTLSQTLFTRERIRIKAEEDVGDAIGDLLDRVMVQSSPSVTGGGKAGRAASPSLGKSGTDVKSPVCLIVVPTRELGVQIALTMYELVGGNVRKSSNKNDKSALRNALKYKGPKGVKIGCVLDDNMSKEGLKLQTDVAITTPKYLTKLLEDGDVNPAKLRTVIFDEADLGLEQTKPEDLKLLFDNDSTREFSRVSYLVGASVTESLGKVAVKDKILPESNSFIATATKCAPLVSEKELLDAEASSNEASPFLASLKDLNLCLDPGLLHERVITPASTGLLCLTRLLRKELREYDHIKTTSQNATKEERNEAEELRRETNEILQEEIGIKAFKVSNEETISNIQRPRVVVFFPDEDTARNNIPLLRDAMWGEHKLGALLPTTGEVPLEIMERFKNGDLTVLLATPNSIRGLDFPALTHVYTLFLPAEDPREYLHLAGRVGRIGQQGSVRGRGGRVTTIIDPEVAPQYEEVANFLGFEFSDIEPLESGVSKESNSEDARRYLEDTVTLLETTAPERDYAEIEKRLDELDLTNWDALLETALEDSDDDEEIEL